MFSAASRLPAAPTVARDEPATRAPAPWGLTRMQPYAPRVEVHYRAIGVDPVTQLGRFVDPDGRIVSIDDARMATSDGTRRMTETGGDGHGPSAPADHDEMID